MISRWNSKINPALAEIAVGIMQKVPPSSFSREAAPFGLDHRSALGDVWHFLLFSSWSLDFIAGSQVSRAWHFLGCGQEEVTAALEPAGLS